MLSKIKELLGKDADTLLSYKAKFPKEQLNLPGPNFVDRIFAQTNRNNNVLKNLEWIFQTGRLAGTGYVSILPVDQGIEHSGGASFAPNPIYFGSEESARQIIEVSEAFQYAHELGMVTILWCYLRNPAFKTKEKDYHVSADLTGQANH